MGKSMKKFRFKKKFFHNKNNNNKNKKNIIKKKFNNNNNNNNNNNFVRKKHIKHKHKKIYSKFDYSSFEEENEEDDNSSENTILITKTYNNNNNNKFIFNNINNDNNNFTKENNNNINNNKINCSNNNNNKNNNNNNKINNNNKNIQKSKLISLNFSKDSFYNQLSQEISSYISSIIPKEENYKKRLTTISLLKSLIHSKFPFWNVYIFGSFSQNLSTIFSDIDFSIITNKKTNYNEIIYDDLFYLNLIKNLLIDKKFGYNLKIIRARVPIIKCVCIKTGIHVDINVNRMNGIKTGEIINKKINGNEIVKNNVILIKMILKIIGFNECREGGMSSFVLFNLVWFYYQFLMKNKMKKIVFIENDNVNNNINNDFDEISDFDFSSTNDSNNDNNSENYYDKLNCSKFFLGFLKFYGIEFDYYKYGISIRNGGFLFKKKEKNHFLCIENFLEIEKDIGKSCFHFNEIRKCFKLIWEKLNQMKFQKINSILDQIGIK